MLNLSLTPFLLAILVMGLAHAEHSAWCTYRLDGDGPIATEVTRYCCYRTRHLSSTAYDRVTNKCWDTQGMIDMAGYMSCCERHAMGTHIPPYKE